MTDRKVFYIEAGDITPEELTKLIEGYKNEFRAADNRPPASDPAWGSWYTL